MAKLGAADFMSPVKAGDKPKRLKQGINKPKTNWASKNAVNRPKTLRGVQNKIG